MKKFFLYILCFFVQFYSASYAHEEILILLDSSLSMADSFNGVPKYKLASDAVRNVLESINNASYIGLRIIGIVLDENIANYLFEPDKLCKATSLIVPISANNIENIDISLNSLMPLGTTPLVYSVDTAIKYDFSQNATLKHIILITDGMDQCNGNPCSYISQIKNVYNNIKIDIIAIGVNNNDLNQLRCFSDETHGNITNIQTPDELKKALVKMISPVYNYNPKNSNSEIEYKNYMIEFWQ